MSPAELARPFVPMRLLGLLGGSSAVCVPAAVLAADLSDFTGLTETLTRLASHAGGELLGRELHQALAPAVDTVMEHGGDVVKFAGDGLLCVFPGNDTQAAEQAAAAIAALEVRGPSGSCHRFRLAVTHGHVTLQRVGGHGGRYELVARGAAIEQAQREAGPGHSGLPPATSRLSPASPDASPPPVDEQLLDPACYLPAHVRDRLNAGLAQWLREVRTLTIVFAAFDLTDDLSELQPCAFRCQAAVQGHAGQLLRLGVEGRTLVAEIAFGLANGPHVAGVAVALRCAAAMAATPTGCRVGVSTGRVLLGPIGSSARMQLTSLGSAVNLAARLMQQARRGEALVDEATWAAGGGAAWAGERRSAVLKGLGERTHYRLQAEAPQVPQADHALLGRDELCAAVRQVLSAREPTARPIVIQGEAGIGKSRFARWLTAELQASGIPVWTALSTPVGQHTPYASLAPAIADMCGLAPEQRGEASLDDVAARLLGDTSRSELLQDALGLTRAGTNAAPSTSGQVRADNIREALLALFTAVGPAALVIEDAHWLDSTSWLLLQRLPEEVSTLRVVIVTRPLAEEEPAALSAIRAHAALVLDLAPLGESETAAVVARQLRVDELPQELSHWINERVRGNPFFAQELSAALATVATLPIEGRRFTRSPSAAELEALKLAHTIERTVEQRIQLLGVEDAVVLKLASVIGPSFGLEELSELSERADPALLLPVINRLMAAGMAVPMGTGRYAFRHGYTHETAYNMLPEDQQWELHARMAGWLERSVGGGTEDRAGDLAHHWHRAQRWEQAANWLERAGQRALSTGADSEAVGHFEKALGLAIEQPAGRLAAWRRQLAQALFGLGQVERVAEEARQAFSLVSRPLPRQPGGWARLAMTTAAKRLGSRLVGQTRTVMWRDPQRRWDELEASRAAALMAESAYFDNKPEMMLASALLAVDMAERTGLVAPVSTAYGMLAVVLGMARMHNTAHRYLDRARTLAEDAQDPYQQGVAWFYAGIYHGCLGDWQASLQACRRGLALTDAQGAYMLSGRQLTIIATNALYTSDYDDTRNWMETMRLRAQRLSNVQQVGWSGNVVSVADLHQGRYADAITRAERSRDIFVRNPDPISLTISEGVRCAALARSGQMADALRGADRAAERIVHARPTTWGQLEGYAGPCEVYAMAVEQGLHKVSELQPRLSGALSALRMFAWVFPFGRARYHRLRAQLSLADGHTRSADHHLALSIATAKRFNMPYEEWQAMRVRAAMPGGHSDRSREHELRMRVEGSGSRAAATPTMNETVQLSVQAD